MKKLMIALAAVAMVATSEAAATNWKATTGSTGVIYDGFNNKDDSYSKQKLSGQTMYVIAVATDTTGVGISQAKLLEAFRTDDSFSLASYAVPTTASTSSHGDTGTGSSAGKIAGFTFTNGDDNSGDFHVSSDKYSFYLATIANDGENDYLYLSDIVQSVAGAPTATKNLQFGPTTSSTKNFGTQEFSAAGWYTAVPEPTSGLLLLLGVAGLALRRRRA